jgi:hypothetical protein
LHIFEEKAVGIKDQLLPLQDQFILEFWPLLVGFGVVEVLNLFDYACVGLFVRAWFVCSINGGVETD